MWKYTLDDDGKVTREAYFHLGGLVKVTVYGQGKQRSEEYYKDEELVLKVYLRRRHAPAGGSLFRRDARPREEIPVRVPMALLVAARYLRTGRRDSGNASTFLSVAGIAVGVMTLTVVLAVMNGFQLGFIESIVEISSYHLQLRPDGPDRRDSGRAAGPLPGRRGYGPSPP